MKTFETQEGPNKSGRKKQETAGSESEGQTDGASDKKKKTRSSKKKGDDDHEQAAQEQQQQQQQESAGQQPVVELSPLQIILQRQDEVPWFGQIIPPRDYSGRQVPADG